MDGISIARGDYCVLQSRNDIVGRLSSIVAQIAAQNQLSQTIAMNDHLVDSGMTSMAMVDLMLAVEAEFDITIPQREMTPTNFQSIASLAHMLAKI